MVVPQVLLNLNKMILIRIQENRSFSQYQVEEVPKEEKKYLKIVLTKKLKKNKQTEIIGGGGVTTSSTFHLGGSGTKTTSATVTGGGGVVQISISSLEELFESSSTVSVSGNSNRLSPVIKFR